MPKNASLTPTVLVGTQLLVEVVGISVVAVDVALFGTPINFSFATSFNDTPSCTPTNESSVAVVCVIFAGSSSVDFLDLTVDRVVTRELLVTCFCTLCLCGIGSLRTGMCLIFLGDTGVLSRSSSPSFNLR